MMGKLKMTDKKENKYFDDLKFQESITIDNKATEKSEVYLTKLLFIVKFSDLIHKLTH